MIDLIKPLLEKGRQEWNDNIKMLLYKKNEDIFEYIDFEDENIYVNPFINLYFSKGLLDDNLDLLKTVLYANWKGDKNIIIDSFAKTYIKNLGWVENAQYVYKKIEPIVVEKPIIIEGTKIELLAYKTPLLDQCFGSYEYDIEGITINKTPQIAKAYGCIKTHFPQYFNLLETYSPYNLIFNTSSSNTNSFASKNALGVAFYNAYQENYDEVYFIEDIAHQTGHVLLYTMMSNKEDYFIVDDQLRIRNFIGDLKGDYDVRTIDIWFHAQFNAYFILKLLDYFIDSDLFSPRQRLEATGRLGLYLLKTYRDMSLVSDFEDSYLPPKKGKVVTDTIVDKILTDKGVEIFEQIKNNWNLIYQKNYDNVFQYNYEGQGSNFNFCIFLKNNPQCSES